MAVRMHKDDDLIQETVIDRPPKRARASFGEVLADMFLPAGYPSSVTDG